MTQGVSTYKDAGVDYGAMDPFKILAQRYANETNGNAANNSNLSLLEWTRGESVAVFQDRESKNYYGFVHEGLGTKNLVADAFATGPDLARYYANVAIDTVAMGVNDAITLGMYPTALTMHLSVGDGSWFQNEARSIGLLRGFRDACQQVGATWAGGETPTLKGIIQPDTCELSCAVIGSGHWVFNPEDIDDGDRIIVFASSGIHANGLTLARKIADGLSNGYNTVMSKSQTYGDALLVPTHLYSQAVKKLSDNMGVTIKYGINITGHGWRKFMRAPNPWKYVLDQPIPVPEVLTFIQRQGSISDEEMYGNFNMGAGFAIIVSDRDAERVFLNRDFLASLPFEVYLAGHVRQSSVKRVEIPWMNIMFTEDTLAVR